MDSSWPPALREVNELARLRYDAALAKRLAEYQVATERRLTQISREIGKLTIAVKDEELARMRWIARGIWVVLMILLLGLEIRR